MMLNTVRSVAFTDIMTQPTVLELKSIGNDEEKIFMMGLILTAIWEYHVSLEGTLNKNQASLRHITVIEEAHRLLQNVSTDKGEDQSNVKGKGVETFSNMLAEIRAYGEGILVADQIPSKLAPDVIKNSNTKIMHRLVAEDDRESMGNSMNLDKHQKRHAAVMDPGEIIFFREGLDRAMNLQVMLAPNKEQGYKLTDKALGLTMEQDYFSNKPLLLKRFNFCQNCSIKDKQECEQVYNAVNHTFGDTDLAFLAVQTVGPLLFNP